MPELSLFHRLFALAHPAPVVEHGVIFQTGVPVTFDYLRRTAPAPYLGEEYQQDIEPGGQYMTHRSPHATPTKGIEFGTVRAECPLVVTANRHDPLDGYDEHSWKMALWDVLRPSLRGQARGIGRQAARQRNEKLRQLLVQAGYDTIVAVVPARGNREAHTTEIVWLAPDRTVGAVPTEEDERLIAKRVTSAKDREQAAILLREADPSPRRPSFAVWLISLITQREADGRRQLVDAKEDALKVREVLEGYLEIRRRNRLHRLAEVLGRSTDLNHPVNGAFVMYRELRDAVQNLLGKSKQTLDVEERIRRGYARVLLDWPDMEILEVSKVEGCPTLFAGTDWCVRFEDAAQDYLTDGNLFLFRLRDNDEGGSEELENAALVYYGGGAPTDQLLAQFMDVNDDPLDAVGLAPIAAAIAWIGSLGQLVDPPLRVNDDSLAARLMYVLFLHPMFNADLTLEQAILEANLLHRSSMVKRVETAMAFLEVIDDPAVVLLLPDNDPANQDIRMGVNIRYSLDYLNDDYVQGYLANSFEEATNRFFTYIDDLLLNPRALPTMPHEESAHFKLPYDVVDELRRIFPSLHGQSRKAEDAARWMKQIWQQLQPDLFDASIQMMDRILEFIPVIAGYTMRAPMTQQHLEQLANGLQLLKEGGEDSPEARTESGVMKEYWKLLLTNWYDSFLLKLRAFFGRP